MFDYLPHSGESQGKVFCTTPGCPGWVWNNRKKVSHCHLCSEPIDWTGVHGVTGNQKGFGKSLKGKGKAKGVVPSQYTQGGFLPEGWPQLSPGPMYQYGWYPPLLPHGAWSKGGPKGRGKPQNLQSQQQPVQPRTMRPGRGKGKDSGGQHGQTPISEDSARKQAEQQLALAQQEVQFYRRVEQKEMLPPHSAQMQAAQERLRKAKLHELGSRSLLQQAKSLRDKLHSLELRLQNQRVEAPRIMDTMATLKEQHQVLAESHIELKKERAEVRARLDLVEHASSKALPESSWKTSGKSDPLDSAFMDFQFQSPLSEPLPRFGYGPGRSC